MNHHLKDCPCPDCVERRASWTLRRLILVLAIAGAILIAIIFAGCSSTVTPAPVESRQASFDQGEQNSGLLKLVDGGAIITAHARDRYNALIAIYGGEILPPIARDYGVTPQTDGTFLITNEALQKFILLNKWRRMGREPAKK